VRVVAADPDAFARRLPEAIRLYAAEYRLAPEAARDREKIMRRHLGRRRFAAHLALEGEDLVGFAYGYAGGPGEYWYDLVHEAMPPAMRAENAPALGLYRRRGWRVLLDDIRFSPGGERFLVMGKRLKGAR